MFGKKPQQPQWTTGNPSDATRPNWRKRLTSRTFLIVLAGVFTLCCSGTVIIGLTTDKKKSEQKADAANVVSLPTSNAPAPATTAATPTLTTDSFTATPTAPAPTTTSAPSATNKQPTATRTTAKAPAPTKTTAKPPAPNLCGAPANPYGYNFCNGAHITSPPGSFCSYFHCISSFWSGKGYVVECKDATFSKSGGIQGVCSQHGGYLRDLYA